MNLYLKLHVAILEKICVSFVEISKKVGLEVEVFLLGEDQDAAPCEVHGHEEL